MSEVFLTAEAEESRETTNFSLMALLGFATSLAGLFSIQYVQMVPVPFAGAALGALALLTAKKFKIGWISKALAVLAVAVGTTTASYGLLYRTIENNYDLVEVKKIAEVYLDNLSKDKLDNVFYLVGFPPELDEGPPGRESATKRAMNRLKEDFAHVEIRGRKTPPKWVFVSVVSEYPNASGHTYKIIYKDEGQSVPPQYYLFVRKTSQKYDKSKSTVNWFVDKLESAKSQ
jgi:hypothetical protein